MFARASIATALLLAAATAFPGRVAAQRSDFERTPEEWLSDCRHDDWGDDREVYCELRDTTLAAVKSLAVDGRENGSITVHGWDRAEMRLVAKIRTSAASEQDARAMARSIRIVTGGRRVAAEGPTTGRHESWSVGFELWVPRQSDLDLEAHNGGVHVESVSGHIEMQTVNGGIALRQVSGDVRGETTNGGVSATLEGDRWHGTGLDLRTTNGGVSLTIPERYNADLETGTVNGGMRIDFPITVQGSVGRQIRTKLGSGGAPIRVSTTNGGVTIRQR